MSYVVVEDKIKETETDQLIEVAKGDVYTIARKLNLGSGFCGFTPPFFLKKAKASKYK